MKKILRLSLGCAGLALSLASCHCCGDGVLQPQMKPEDGTPQAPAAKVGEAPKEAWTPTTVEAAVAGQPNAGKIVTVVGEVIDVSCYWQLGKHGQTHKDCAQKCMRAGQPIGLLTDKGAVYLLMAEEHHPRRDGETSGFRDRLIEHAADIIEVTGTATTVNGQKALFVQGFVRKP